jgi:hypothetical protein
MALHRSALPSTIIGVELFGSLGLLLLGAAVVFVVVNALREGKRQDRIAQWAAGHCWSIRKKPDVSWARRLPGRNGRVGLLVSASIGGLTVGVADTPIRGIAAVRPATRPRATCL